MLVLMSAKDADSKESLRLNKKKRMNKWKIKNLRANRISKNLEKPNSCNKKAKTLKMTKRKNRLQLLTKEDNSNLLKDKSKIS